MIPLRVLMLVAFLFLQGYAIMYVAAHPGTPIDGIALTSTMVLFLSFMLGMDLTIELAKKGYVKGVRPDETSDRNSR